MGLRVDIQLAGVNQTLDGFLDLDERAKRRDVGDRAADQLTKGIALVNGFPGVRLEAAQTQANAFAVGIHLDNHDFDFLTGRKHFAWVVDPLPGQLRNVGQAIGTTQIDKRAEVGKLVDTARKHVARLKFGKQPMLLGLAPFLGGKPL